MKDVFLGMNESDHFDLYHDFAEKLSASKKSVDVDESLRFAYEAQVQITEDLKAQGDRVDIDRILKIFFAVCAVVFLLHIVLEGLWVGILGIVSLAITLILIKILLTRQINTVASIDTRVEAGKLLQKKDLEKRRLYNLEIIRLKSWRYWILMLSAAFFTPLILLSVNEMVIGTNNLLTYAIAIVFGSFFWMIYFHSDIDLLKKKREETLRI